MHFTSVESLVFQMESLASKSFEDPTGGLGLSHLSFSHIYPNSRAPTKIQNLIVFIGPCFEKP